MISNKYVHTNATAMVINLETIYFRRSITFSVSTPKVWNIPEIPPKARAGMISSRSVRIFFMLPARAFMPVVTSSTQLSGAGIGPGSASRADEVIEKIMIYPARRAILIREVIIALSKILPPDNEAGAFAGLISA